jgi:hypothetical protein
VIIGEECHIVSSKKNGPRGNEEFDGDFDNYDNLILLCGNDHTRIDSVPSFFPSHKLRDLKYAHEQWVKAALRKDAAAFSNPQFHMESLARIRTGKQLLDIVLGSHAHQFDYPEFDDREESETVADFFQLMQDYGDIWSEIEVSERIRIGFELNSSIKEIEATDLLLFGSQRKMKIRLQYEPTNKPPMDWNIATIAAVRPNNPSIFGDFIIAAFNKKVGLF